MSLEDDLKMKFKTPQDKAILSVIAGGITLTAELNGFLKQYDLSEQQYNVLRILKGQKGNPINLFSITERMLHKSSNVTRLIEKLRLKGLVERKICENNRRKVEIVATQTGLDLLQQIDAKYRPMLNRRNKRLTNADAEQLSQLIEKVIH